MLFKVNIASYNCRGIKSAVTDMSKLCEDNQIIQLQETMLCSHNLDFIHIIHDDFYSAGCLSVDSSERILTGRQSW